MSKRKGLTRPSVTGGHLGQVSVVVALHLQVEDLRLGVARLGNQVFVEEALVVEREEKRGDRLVQVQQRRHIISLKFQP